MNALLAIAVVNIPFFARSVRGAGNAPGAAGVDPVTAAADHHIDVARAIMIGDSAKDIACARNAGCGMGVLVKTGDYSTAAAALCRTIRNRRGVFCCSVSYHCW